MIWRRPSLSLLDYVWRTLAFPLVECLQPLYTSLQLLARNPTTTFWRLLRCWQLAVFLQVVSHMFMLPCARGEGSTGIACGLFFAPVSFITGMLACTIEVGSFWTTTTSHASSYFRLLIQFSWVIFLFLLQFEAVHQFF